MAEYNHSENKKDKNVRQHVKIRSEMARIFESLGHK